MLQTVLLQIYTKKNCLINKELDSLLKIVLKKTILKNTNFKIN
jgi:hypothetical protein